MINPQKGFNCQAAYSVLMGLSPEADCEMYFHMGRLCLHSVAEADKDAGVQDHA